MSTRKVCDWCEWSEEWMGGVRKDVCVCSSSSNTERTKYNTVHPWRVLCHHRPSVSPMSIGEGSFLHVSTDNIITMFYGNRFALGQMHQGYEHRGGAGG